MGNSNRRIITATEGNCLFCKTGELYQFARKVIIPHDGIDEWKECTEDERNVMELENESWLEAHKPIDPPEPPQVEDAQADVVE